MVCAELAPLAKTGGLGDAIAGLCVALARAGHDVRVLLPNYGLAAHPVRTLDTFLSKSAEYRYVEIRHELGAVRVYLLDTPEFGDGMIYTGDVRDARRFFALADAGARLPAALEWMPDVIHCHDWHAALVPVLLRKRSPRVRPKTMLTLHNIGYQGEFAADVLEADERTGVAASIDATATPPTINYLRAGLEEADVITTVSPTYAREIQTSAYGAGLDDILRARRSDLVGILNGVDYSIWDPRVDPYIGAHYDRHEPGGKQRVKQALCRDMGLACGPGEPLLGVVSRLVPQKGIDLLATLLPQILERSGARFALLGSGDPELERMLAGFAEHAPARVAFKRGYHEALAHRILAGSDIIVVPSRYEPCGLTQMYALRFGSIPVVRATGGLADTVQHFDPASGRGNGSVFEHADTQSLAWGIEEACRWFADAPTWARVVANAMAADFSWDRQVPEYVAAYRRLVS
ncbi:MAG TPA: glycogen/starch synthase [Gammaproteobacteria bacterium]